MTTRPSVETRLLLLRGGIALIAILGVLAILPYRLYARDIRHASVQAHCISSVVHTAISRTLAEGADATELVNRLQGIGDVEIRLRKLAPGEEHPRLAVARARAGATEPT